VQALCQEAGIIFMAGLTHSNDTTGKDKKANGFRHFFNSYMSGAALAPVLAKNYGKDRKAYHLTADYNWGYTTEQAVKESTEALGWETVAAVKTPLTQTDFSSYIASMASHHHRLHTLATCKPCFGLMLLNVLARSTHVALLKLSKALSSTVWAMVKHCTVLKITSASKTYLS